MANYTVYQLYYSPLPKLEHFLIKNLDQLYPYVVAYMKLRTNLQLIIYNEFLFITLVQTTLAQWPKLSQNDAPTLQCWSKMTKLQGKSEISLLKSAEITVLKHQKVTYKVYENSNDKLPFENKKNHKISSIGNVFTISSISRDGVQHRETRICPKSS